MSVQRLIMYDLIKSILCFSETPYILKRAYLSLLFEVYINKVIDQETGEKNDPISAHEISEILSMEIIPQLDTKNIYIYLEGLVKIPKTED